MPDLRHVWNEIVHRHIIRLRLLNFQDASASILWVRKLRLGQKACITIFGLRTILKQPLTHDVSLRLLVQASQVTILLILLF